MPLPTTRPARRPRHPAAEVQLPGLTAHVDTGMVRVVELLWDLGLVTRSSCQDDSTRRDQERGERWALLMFEELDHLVRFLHLFDGTDLAGRRYGQTWRREGGPDGPLVPDLPRRWRYSLSVRPPRHAGEQFALSGSVRFPADDLPAVEARLGEVARGVRRPG
ncbi:MAG: hypothetical protein ACKO04_09150 [Actinomycetes bacterium]